LPQGGDRPRQLAPAGGPWGCASCHGGDVFTLGQGPRACGMDLIPGNLASRPAGMRAARVSRLHHPSRGTIRDGHDERHHRGESHRVRRALPGPPPSAASRGETGADPRRIHTCGSCAPPATWRESRAGPNDLPVARGGVQCVPPFVQRNRPCGADPIRTAEGARRSRGADGSSGAVARHRQRAVLRVPQPGQDASRRATKAGEIPQAACRRVQSRQAGRHPGSAPCRTSGCSSA